LDNPPIKQAKGQQQGKTKEKTIVIYFLIPFIELLFFPFICRAFLLLTFLFIFAIILLEIKQSKTSRA